MVERCKQGDRKAQYELYKLYSRAMLNTCVRMLNHEGEAEDVLQDAFVDAFMKIGTFRQEASFGLWLKQIVVNKAINHLRTRRLELVDMEDNANHIEDSSPEKDVEEDEQNWQIERINRAMEKLPDGYRVVLTMYLFEGYDHEEIAQVLGISESTSRTQYMRAKSKLLQIMGGKNE